MLVEILPALSTVFFAAIGGYAGALWKDITYSRLYEGYLEREYHIRMSYLKSKKLVIAKYSGKLVGLWLEFTGEPHHEPDLLLGEVEEEIHSLMETRNHRIESLRTPSALLLGVLLGLFKKRNGAPHQSPHDG